MTQRTAALGLGPGKAVPAHLAEDEEDFPPPTVREGDDLALEEQDPQSFEEFCTEEMRNKVIGARKTIYVVPVGDGWHAAGGSGGSAATSAAAVSPPAVSDIADYLAAFYHGMRVKLLPHKPVLEWSTGQSKGKGKAKTAPRFVALPTSKGEALRIRVRPSPDALFPQQLNLNDVLDCMAEDLPSDAYCILGLTLQDIWEGDDDDFTCGRAYGASRIAVVSLARYHPNMDTHTRVSVTTSWPHDTDYPHAAAVAAAKALSPPAALSDLTQLWLSRAVKTAAHEVGHCLALDHCVYYACTMQGTASLSEDNRCPFELCPVDLHKLLSALAEGGCIARAGTAAAVARYKALLEYCQHPTRARTHAFAAHAAWLKTRLSKLQGMVHSSSGTSGGASGAAAAATGH